MSLVRGLYSCFLSSELRRSKSFSSLRSESKSFTRTILIKATGPLHYSGGDVWMERENIFTTKARENVSEIQGRCRKGREGNRKRDGRQSQWEEAMKKGNFWEKAMERRESKHSAWKEEGNGKWPWAGAGAGAGALLCLKAWGGTQMQRYRQGTYGCCAIALSFEKWTKEDSRELNGYTGHQTVQGERDVEMKYSWFQDSGYVSLFFSLSL